MFHATAYRRGFTLVEILVVIVILGIASAVIVPNIVSRDDMVAAAAARVVMSDLIYAQNQAIATQRDFIIKFEDQKYSMYDSRNPTTPIKDPLTQMDYVRTLKDMGELRNIQLADVKFNTDSTTLVFDYLGCPKVIVNGSQEDLTSGAISVLCKKGDRELARLNLTIQPFTGEILVEDPSASTTTP